MGNKSFYIFLFIITFCREAKTQTNLVYNGDFELYSACPTSPTYPGNLQIELSLGWYAPTFATPDYYNICGAPIVGVPANGFGFQIPYSGNAYSGILNQNCTQAGSCDGWWVEYIQSKLLSSLIGGRKYHFSCRLALSKFANDYVFWKFGTYFSITPLTSTGNKPFNVTP